MLALLLFVLRFFSIVLLCSVVFCVFLFCCGFCYCFCLFFLFLSVLSTLHKSLSLTISLPLCPTAGLFFPCPLYSAVGQDPVGPDGTKKPVWLLSNDKSTLVPVSSIRGVTFVAPGFHEFGVAVSMIQGLPLFQDDIKLQEALLYQRCPCCKGTHHTAWTKLWNFARMLANRRGDTNVSATELARDVLRRKNGEVVNEREGIVLPPTELSSKYFFSVPELYANRDEEGNRWERKQTHPVSILVETLARCQVCLPHCKLDIERTEMAHALRPALVFEGAAERGKEVQVTRLPGVACSEPGCPSNSGIWEQRTWFEPMAPSGLHPGCVLEVPVGGTSVLGDITAQDAIDSWARKQRVRCDVKGCNGRVPVRRHLVSHPPHLIIRFVAPGEDDPGEYRKKSLPFRLHTARNFRVPIDANGEEFWYRVNVVNKRAVNNWFSGYDKHNFYYGYSYDANSRPTPTGWDTGNPSFLVEVLDFELGYFVRRDGSRSTTVTDELALSSADDVQIDCLIGSPAEAQAPSSDDRPVRRLTFEHASGSHPRSGNPGKVFEWYSQYRPALREETKNPQGRVRVAFVPFTNVSVRTNSKNFKIHFTVGEPVWDGFWDLLVKAKREWGGIREGEILRKPKDRSPQICLVPFTDAEISGRIRDTWRIIAKLGISKEGGKGRKKGGKSSIDPIVLLQEDTRSKGLMHPRGGYTTEHLWMPPAAPAAAGRWKTFDEVTFEDLVKIWRTRPADWIPLRNGAVEDTSTVRIPQDWETTLVQGKYGLLRSIVDRVLFYKPRGLRVSELARFAFRTGIKKFTALPGDAEGRKDEFFVLLNRIRTYLSGEHRRAGNRTSFILINLGYGLSCVFPREVLPPFERRQLQTQEAIALDMILGVPAPARETLDITDCELNTVEEAEALEAVNQGYASREGTLRSRQVETDEFVEMDENAIVPGEGPEPVFDPEGAVEEAPGVRVAVPPPPTAVEQPQQPAVPPAVARVAAGAAQAQMLTFDQYLAARRREVEGLAEKVSKANRNVVLPIIKTVIYARRSLQYDLHPRVFKRSSVPILPVENTDALFNQLDREERKLLLGPKEEEGHWIESSPTIWLAEEPAPEAAEPAMEEKVPERTSWPAPLIFFWNTKIYWNSETWKDFTRDTFAAAVYEAIFAEYERLGFGLEGREFDIICICEGGHCFAKERSRETRHTWMKRYKLISSPPERGTGGHGMYVFVRKDYLDTHKIELGPSTTDRSFIHFVLKREEFPDAHFTVGHLPVPTKTEQHKYALGRVSTTLTRGDLQPGSRWFFFGDLNINLRSRQRAHAQGVRTLVLFLFFCFVSLLYHYLTFLYLNIYYFSTTRVLCELF